jgi:hypothetical protein
MLDPAPVAQIAGSYLGVSAKFKIDCHGLINAPGLLAKAKSNNGIEFPSVTLKYENSSQLFVYAGTQTPYAYGNQVITPSKVDYFEEFEIKWWLSVDNGNTWYFAGESVNPLYVPLSDLTYTGGCFSRYWGPLSYYSVVHYACAPAKGLYDKAKITEAIYKVFQTRKVPRIEKPQNDAMLYWGCTNALTNECRGIGGLLDNQDANCGEWAAFLQYCIAMHNIESCLGAISMKYVEVPIMQDFQFTYINTFKEFPPSGDAEPKFLVDHWTIPDLFKFYVNNHKFPTYLISPPLPTSSFACYQTTGFFKSASGATILMAYTNPSAAQGIKEPEGLFTNHGVVDIGGVIYDASYGTPPYNGGFTEWEQKEVNGYAIETYFKDPTTGMVYPLVWPYGLTGQLKYNLY